MNQTVPRVEFAEERGFKLEPRYFSPSPGLQKRFAELQDELLAGELGETETVGLHRRLKAAANEAASLAWTSSYPLLVFPVLFAEIALRERLRADRQQRIFSRSEMLPEHAV